MLNRAFVSRYVALSLESKLYSVCNRSLSLKSVGEGEVEYLLSISAMERKMSFSLDSLAFFALEEYTIIRP